jgi:hypothetical protein
MCFSIFCWAVRELFYAHAETPTTWAESSTKAPTLQKVSQMNCSLKRRFISIMGIKLKWKTTTYENFAKKPAYRSNFNNEMLFFLE